MARTALPFWPFSFQVQSAPGGMGLPLTYQRHGEWMTHRGFQERTEYGMKKGGGFTIIDARAP